MRVQEFVHEACDWAGEQLLQESRHQFLTLCAIPNLNTRMFLKFTEELPTRELSELLQHLPKRMLEPGQFPAELKIYESKLRETQLELNERDELIRRLTQPKRLKIKNLLSKRTSVFGEVSSKTGLSVWDHTRSVKGFSVKTIFDIGGRSSRNLGYSQIVSFGKTHVGSFSICQLYGIASQTVWTGDFQKPDAIADACTEVCSRFNSFLESI